MEDTPPFIPIRTRQPARYGASMSSADSAVCSLDDGIYSVSIPDISAHALQYGSASESSYPAATHDISRVNYHVKHIDAFARALEDVSLLDAACCALLFSRGMSLTLQ